MYGKQHSQFNEEELRMLNAGIVITRWLCTEGMEEEAFIVHVANVFLQWSPDLLSTWNPDLYNHLMTMIFMFMMAHEWACDAIARNIGTISVGRFIPAGFEDNERSFGEVLSVIKNSFSQIRKLSCP